MNKIKVRIGKRIIALVMTLIVICSSFAGCGKAEEDMLKITFFNQMPWIGDNSGPFFYHGDCTYIEFPNGQNMVIDMSTSFSGRNITEKLVEMGLEKIDYFIATHLHHDHVEGLKPLVAKIPVENLIYSGYGIENADAVPMSARLFWMKINEQTVRQGDSLDFGDVHFDILWPAEDAPEAPSDLSRAEQGEYLNNYSMVFRMTYGDFSALFTADIHVETEAMLVEQYGDQLQSDLLKVPHHGNATSTSDEFVAAVNPKLGVVMSTGAEWTVQRKFSNRCIPLYGTYSDGDITVQTDGSTMNVTCWKGTQEYSLGEE